MTTSSMTTYAALMKERYLDPSVVEKLTYPDNPLLGMLEKKGDTGMVGKYLVVPIITKNAQGVGGLFSVAQAAATPTGSDQFQIEAGSYYGVVEFDDKTIAAARTNAGAFLVHKKFEIDSLYETMAENLSIHLWGNGGGNLRQGGHVDVGGQPNSRMLNTLISAATPETGAPTEDFGEGPGGLLEPIMTL